MTGAGVVAAEPPQCPVMAFTPVDAPDEVLALIDQLVGSVVIKR